MASEIRKFYEFGKFRFDAQTHCLKFDDELVQLAPKSLEALGVLLENRGDVVTREALLEAVWEESYVDDANLTVAISSLRKTLSSYNGHENYIQTIARKGYRFTAEVEEKIEIRDEPIVVGHSSIEHLTFVQKPLLSRLTRYGIAVGVLTMLGGAALFWNAGFFGPTQRPRSVGVLPMRNLTGDINNDFLADGIAESLIASISKVDDLKVIARNSAFSYKDQDVDPVAVGQKLGVDTLLQGSLQRDGEELRVVLNLVNAKDGKLLWADEISRPGHRIFELQNEMARRVLTGLSRQLNVKNAVNFAKNQTEDAEAYRLCLKGRYFWNKRNEDGLRKALDSFQQALDRDPNYALAYSGLADSYSMLYYYSQKPFPEGFPRAKAAAKRAIEIDPDLAEAHATLGFVNAATWQWQDVESEYKRAIEINPNYATAHHWYAFYLSQIARHDDAIREVKIAENLDPLSPMIHTDVAAVLTDARHHDEAIKQIESVFENDPSFDEAHFNSSFVYDGAGQPEKAIAELNRVIEKLGRRPNTLAMLAYSYAKAQKPDEAKNILRQLQTTKDGEKVSPFFVAAIYSALGDKRQALDSLKAAYAERSPWLISLNNSLMFDELRSEPEFTDLLKQIGFET